MAQIDERAAIELDEQQLKKNPLWNHVVLSFLFFHQLVA
jgi:hypothetical protein